MVWRQIPLLRFYKTIRYTKSYRLLGRGRTGKLYFTDLNSSTVRLQFLPVGKNWQGSSYSANSLLFRPRKKTPPEPPIPDGNNYLHNQFTRRQTSRGRTTKLNILDKVAPSAPVFAFRQKLARAKQSANQQDAPTTSQLPVLHLQNWKLAVKPFYPNGAFSLHPRTFLLASFAIAKLEAGGNALLS